MSKAPKILITDVFDKLLVENLTELGYKCLVDSAINREELLREIKDCTGLIVTTKVQIDKEVINAAKNLRFIARGGSGMENIDADYAASKGITCFNTPKGNSDAVAEHAIGMLLALFNNLIKADAQVRRQIWEREANRGIELKGKTIAVIGYGNTGSALATKLRGFEGTILAYDKYKKNFGSDYIQEVSLAEVFDHADVVSLHLPYNIETHNFVEDAFLKKFKKPIYLINTSRGKIVNTQDLILGIENGKILGGCLDVLENEKLDTLQPDELERFNYLIKNPKVILSPHVAGWTHQSKRKIAELIVDKISKF